MFDNLLISSIEEFIGNNVKLEINGFMNLNSDIDNLKFSLQEDICELRGDNNFFISLNVNQICNIEKNSNSIKIFVDSDLSILIHK